MFYVYHVSLSLHFTERLNKNSHRIECRLRLSADNFRPYLTSFQGNAFTDYINAVLVDGYTKPRGKLCFANYTSNAFSSFSS